MKNTVVVAGVAAAFLVLAPGAALATTPTGLYCGPEHSTAWFEVLPAAKQVAKVPSGAPQTGGTDRPVDDSGFPAAAAMGVLAVGGTGLVLARRARRR